MQDIAEDGDVEILDGAQAVSNRQRIQQALRRMFVGAVAGVHHRNVQMPRNVMRRAGSRVPHHQAIRLHGVEIEDRVEERLALLQARGLGLQVHGVCAEP